MYRAELEPMQQDDRLPTCRTMKLLLSPHNDDESLFAAYTLIREKPTVLIITDSDMQLDRGISAAQRKEESRRACETLGVPVRFLGLKDGSVKEDDLRQRLLPFTEQDWDCVYAPAIEGGHPEHDLLGRVASSLFRNVRYYSTYKDPAVPPRGQHLSPPHGKRWTSRIEPSIAMRRNSH